MAPMPVMATRRIRYWPALECWRLRHQFLDPFHHLAHVADLLRLLVGNGDVELVLEREENLDGVHGIDVELFEGLSMVTVSGNALGGGDDFEDSLDQFVGHSNLANRFEWNPRSCNTGIIGLDCREVSRMSGLRLAARGRRAGTVIAPLAAPATSGRTIPSAARFQSWPMTVHITPSSPSRPALPQARTSARRTERETAAARAGGLANSLLGRAQVPG